MTDQLKLDNLIGRAILDTIILLNGYSGRYCRLVEDGFNTICNINETTARAILERYGTFKAVNKVKGYEVDNYFKTYTNVANPKDLLNTLVFILTEDLFYDLPTVKVNWGKLAKPEINQQIKEELLSELERRV